MYLLNELLIFKTIIGLWFWLNFGREGCVIKWEKHFFHIIEIILLLEKEIKWILKMHNMHKNQGLIIPAGKKRRKDEGNKLSNFLKSIIQRPDHIK